MDFVDRRAVGRDRVNLSVFLPDAVGRAFDNLDHDLVGIELADACLSDERIGLEAGARICNVEERKRFL